MSKCACSLVDRPESGGFGGWLGLGASLVAAVVVCGPAAGQAFSWSGSGADDRWLNSDNWDLPGVPNGVGQTAAVLAPAPTRLDGTASIDGMFVAANGELIVTPNGQLNVLGPDDLFNDGQITLVGSTTAASGGTLGLQADQGLFGIGRLTLAGDDTAVRRTGTSTQLFRLTVGADQTVDGFGQLGADSLVFDHNGLIDANAAGQTLLVNPGNGTDSLVNRGLMRATNGGTLELSGAGGGSFFNLETVHAADGSTVLLTNNPSLNGGSGNGVSGGGTGTLSTTGSGVISLADNDSAFLFGQVVTGRLEIGKGSMLSLNGAIAEDGLLIGQNLPANVLPGFGATTVEVVGDLENRGTVIADGGGLLYFSIDAGNSLTNRGVLRAANGSVLTIDVGERVDQRGVIEAVDGGRINVRSLRGMPQFETNNGIDALTGGTYRAINGKLTVAPNGFDLVVNDGADLVFHGTSAETNIFSDTATTPGSLVSDQFDTNAGSLRLTGGADLTTRLTGPFDFTNVKTLTVGAGSTFAVVDGNGDRRTLNNEQGSPSIIEGDGTIFADVVNGFTGEIRPESPDGTGGLATLTIDGDLTLTDESGSGSGGVYLDATANDIDTLVVTGTANLAGALYINSVSMPFASDLSLLRSASLALTQEVLVLDAETIVGSFDLVSVNGDTTLATRIDFASGDVFVLIPEPGVLATLAAALLLVRRRPQPI